MIEVENLSKTFDVKIRKGLFKSERKQVEAVKRLDMEITKGKIVGLLGINGAGKTTSIKMLSTLLLPTGGRITIDGLDAVKDSMQIKKRINMVAGGERMIYWRLTGRENLWYYGQLYGIEDDVLNNRIDELLKLVGIVEKQDVPVENYSKGMKQRLQIARGLINDPDYVFMDEPTLGLDSVIAKELRAYVKKIAVEENKGILLTSHYMAEIEELCDFVYILNNGEVIAKGTPKELALLGLKKKTLLLDIFNDSDDICEMMYSACKRADRSAEIDRNEGSYTITSSVDLKAVISRTCMDNGTIITKLYEEEPSLEDAIIEFSKGA